MEPSVVEMKWYDSPGWCVVRGIVFIPAGIAGGMLAEIVLGLLELISTQKSVAMIALMSQGFALTLAGILLGAAIAPWQNRMIAPGIMGGVFTLIIGMFLTAILMTKDLTHLAHLAGMVVGVICGVVSATRGKDDVDLA